MKSLRAKATGDELDAATAALVGRWYMLGCVRTLGGRGGILVPDVWVRRVAEDGSRPH